MNNEITVPLLAGLHTSLAGTSRIIEALVRKGIFTNEDAAGTLEVIVADLRQDGVEPPAAWFEKVAACYRQ